MLRSCLQNVPSGRDPQAKSRQKIFEISVATDLNLLALLPLLTSLMTDLNTLAIASKKAAEAPTLYRRTSQFCPVMFLDTEVSRRLMHQRHFGPPLSGNERTEFL